MSASPTLASNRRSPVSPSFPVHSNTHAGGIQPSASFFRPSKPHYSRPSSPVGNNDNSTTLEDDYPLYDISKRTSDSTEQNHENSIPVKGLKQSREPLIDRERPIGGVVVSPPSTGHGSSSAHAHGSRPAPSRSTTSRIRSSLDMVFNLRRGVSMDSNRHEKRIQDEEQGINLPTHYAPSTTSTHDPSVFMPSRHGAASLGAVPRLDPKTGKPMRNYQLHPSRNRFFFGGRLLSGGDAPWAFAVSFALVLTVPGLWFGTTCQWWWLNMGAGGKVMVILGGYLALLVISSMLATATMDPGILPRDLDPDPPYPSTSPSDGGMRAPLPRDLKVRSDVVRVKYCPTCKTYRPPRSSHCKMCDNCVDGCDHHCQWVNNCVGRRNYTTFFVLLLTTTITLVLIICTSALHLYLVTRKEHVNFRHALSNNRGAGSAAVFSLSILVIWPVAALFSYHLRLLVLNITTIEQIRNQAHKTLVPGPAPPNPFSHGSWRRNVLAVLCRPPGYSWLDASGIATEDKREVNPRAHI
ncbi:Eukaryotic peptide chain release factor GTP-binding subunit [Stygiomarasmius scandens]|uniref:Palmitoyltransferase n=1 Tax=Marasmiellus scandens TaxID=2682957 RepID=A0ABR1K099_9AGAR